MTDNLSSTSSGPVSFKEKTFGNAQFTHLDIELFDNDLAEMREFFQRGTFNTDNEGWRYLLAAGYSYLRGQQRLEPADDSGRPNPIGAEENLQRLVQIEAMYAVLKQRAYVWMKDHEIMDLQNNALYTMAFGYQTKCEDLEVENKTLKAELIQWRQSDDRSIPTASIVRHGASTTNAVTPWWKRLLGRKR